MKLWDIVKNVGASAINVALPGAGSAILSLVNGFLPDDKKLPENATGYDIDNVLHELPPEQRVEIMSKEFDVDITQIKESYSTVRSVIENDAKMPHTTRPYIAKGSFQVIAFTIITTISIWGYGVVSENVDITRTVMEGWKFVLAVMGPLVTLLWAYFGVLKQEHKNRLDAAGGNQPQSGVVGLISKLFKGGK